MKPLSIVPFCVFIIFSLFSCKNSTEPEKPKELAPYMTLNVGDIKQYYTEKENLCIQWKVIGETIRQDDQKVFVIDYSILLPDGLYSANFYHFIKDGYFWQTNLDTVTSPVINKSNPFLESKIAKIYPATGDYFLSTDGVVDSEKTYERIKIIDSLETFCKTFKQVAEYEMIDVDTVRNTWLYYAPKYGHVGTLIKNQNGSSPLFVTYVKINGEEFGKYIPMDSGIIESNSTMKENIISLLFSK